ncbi:hypothetical protein ACIRBX_32175 [Kitasatospora sp. NPDC096147]|uniref:hypothetical protein n=1 Tax=Kitasatospora sp. NPDC096147 TaxID=3364093 RepID=UPI003829E31F
MRIATRIIGTAALAALALTGCGSTGTTTTSPKTTAAAPAEGSVKTEAPKAEAAKSEAPKSEAPAAPATSAAPKPASGIPSPDAAQTAALVAALNAVHPALAVKADKAVGRARNVCTDIQRAESDALVLKNAKARFEGGDVPPLTDAQGLAIVAAVKASFCK